MTTTSEIINPLVAMRSKADIELQELLADFFMLMINFISWMNYVLIPLEET